LKYTKYSCAFKLSSAAKSLAGNSCRLNYRLLNPLQNRKNRLILKKKQEGTDMKSIKSILKIAGAVMAVIGTVLVVVGFLDEICAGVKKLAACRARREEMKDYAD
jgi:hypothetical protein